jgi:DNA-binding winged helix-turn-helix (wHTH) protein
MNQAVVHRVLRFDRFALDLTRGCLRVGERDIELRPKTFEVLRYLAENAGRLVAKQELFEAIWPNVIVSDDSIAQCIRELRNKLGDGNHSLIKTVSRRGYLLDATVSAEATQRLPQGLAVMPPEAPQPQLGSQPRVGTLPAHKLGASAIAVALLSAAWWVSPLPDWDAAKLAVQPKLEKLQTGDQFDGIWRVEFSNNELCARKSSTGLWIIRQGVLKSGGTGTTVGTVSSTGALRATWPALVDPALTNVGSAKLLGGRGEGTWDGQWACGGALTLTRLSGL